MWERVNDVQRVKGRFVLARESDAKARAILDTTVDGIITIDAASTVESFNQAAEEIFGYDAEEVIGENVKMLMPSPYRERKSPNRQPRPRRRAGRQANRVACQGIPHRRGRQCLLRRMCADPYFLFLQGQLFCAHSPRTGVVGRLPVRRSSQFVSADQKPYFHGKHRPDR
ncbi:MAG: hypothetical protein BRD27_02415 [Bacteroidetes bacterium QH_10_64_19]|nr:MAG: hypothetical protein BRD27_02415 [Bacteroidetes bacterium QH_10_64_19]